MQQASDDGRIVFSHGGGTASAGPLTAGTTEELSIANITKNNTLIVGSMVVLKPTHVYVAPHVQGEFVSLE